MEDLVKLRNSVKSQLALLLTRVNKHDVSPICNFEISILSEKIKTLSEQSAAIHTRIISKCATVPDADAQELIYAKIEEKSNVISIKLMTISADLKAAQAAAAVKPPTPTKQNIVRLPPIELPVFNGNFEGWTSFQDLFLATIHNNKSLSGAQKLQYLKSTLRGEAESLVKSLLVTDINYTIAWNLLNDRYDNQREIVNSLMRKLFNQPVLTKESQSALQTLLDTTNECIRALSVLGRPVEKWDDILVFLVTERMDAESRRRWAMSLQGTDIPAFDKLAGFLDGHIRGLAASTSGKGECSSKTFSSSGGGGSQQQASTYHTTSTFNSKCTMCKEEHPLFRCQKFISSTIEIRSNLVKKNSLCFNCLRAGHNTKSCKSSSTCKICNRKHHSLLHFENSSNLTQSSTAPEAATGKTVNFTKQGVNSTQTLLATAIIKVVNSSGVEKICRALLDNGSEVSFITQKVVTFLNLKKTSCNITLQGLQSAPVGLVKEQAQVKVQSMNSNESVTMEALIVPTISSELPKYSIKSGQWSHLKGLNLADPKYFKPSSVDLLLGGDIYAEVMRDGRRSGPQHTPIAQNSIFGWVVSGRIASTQKSIIQVNHTTCDLESTDSILRKFWELEEVPATKHLTPDEKKCEDHFKSNHVRDSEGKFTVKLPFKPQLADLGESRNSAVRRWRQVERRLAQQPTYQKQYHEFMREYLSLNHMERVPEQDMTKGPGEVFYLPHHFVLKAAANALKFRVVFDGSAKSTSGVSLNDCMYVGPTIQDDLFSLFLRFRLHPIALKADIKKMYRQFKVDKDQVDYQRIVYRETPDQPLRDYRLLTVTYGTASAPFLATRCLKQLAEDERNEFPEVAAVLEKELYVDDLISGCQTVQEASKMQQQLAQITSRAGLELCKWSTNSKKVLDTIPIELRETSKSLSLDIDESIKALGVQWNPCLDTFSFSVVTPSLPVRLTKRTMLSELAKVYDPLGSLSPTTINAKMMFQKLWKIQNLNWDDTLPPDISQQWMNYQKEMRFISDISIPRCLIEGNVTRRQLHGFCDASEKAYAAVIFLQCTYPDGSVKVRNVTAKTRVAPDKIVSLPRLELCGALLLSKLLTIVEEQYQTQNDVIAWTDSTIVLNWLASSPSRWKTFVANRVSEIQDLIPHTNWHHVISELNPADCASRGISASELRSLKLWWDGPDFLKSDKYPIFTQPCFKTLVEGEERKKVVTIRHICVKENLINSYSSLARLQRVTAYCLRFINNIKKNTTKRSGFLSTVELQEGLLHWISHEQQLSFKVEIKALKLDKSVPPSSSLLTLNPFMDAKGIIRVGGRLQHANIPEHKKHPIVLPQNSVLTKLLVESYHMNYLHAGIQLLQANIRDRYWIIRSKDVIRKITRKCVVCRRHRAATTTQLMGNLPSPRVTPSRAFMQCGVDYAGPINVCAVKGRGQKTFKHYIALFVCLATKAIHLESVSDLSTEAFLASYKRFTSRRGISSDLFSDCGTNFVGADRELQMLLESSRHNDNVSHHLSDKGTRWHFNPPSAPHHGGLWEAGVKSVKFHLKRVVGSARMTYEDFQTYLCQIESCLNSRPLCAMSNDPSDLSVLTPGHFLIGEPLSAIPEPDLTSLKVNTLSRWQFTQQLTQHFWKRWSSEYLSNLQQRFKWTSKRSNYQVDDLVIIKDDSQPPMKWKMGRVLEVFPGSDDCVRVVNLRTASGEMERPVVKLCPLITYDDNFN